MNYIEIITAIKKYIPNLPPTEILAAVNYIHNGKTKWGESGDINSEIRRKLVKEIYEELDPSFRNIIRYLLEQEIIFCRKETVMTHTLRRLCFVLYKYSEIEDIPLLYEAKFDTSFDAQGLLDIELIYGKDKEAIKNYFTKHPIKFNIVDTINQNEKDYHFSYIEYLEHINNYYPNEDEEEG